MHAQNIEAKKSRLDMDVAKEQFTSIFAFSQLPPSCLIAICTLQSLILRSSAVAKGKGSKITIWEFDSRIFDSILIRNRLRVKCC